MQPTVFTMRCALIGLALAATISAGFMPALAQDYAVTDLGTLGGPVSAAYGVNDFGTVTGFSVLSDADFNGFVHDCGLTAITPLPAQSQSHAFDINGAGQVVAMSYDLGEMHSHGLMWQQGTVTNLGSLAPRGTNENGTVVGYLSMFDPDFGWVDHAARWEAGVLMDLGTLGGHFSYAYAVDGLGRVVGVSFTTDDVGPRAALRLAGVWHDLGTLGGAKSHGYDINDSGEVVGVADTAAGKPHAFLFTIDATGNVLTRTDLGTLGGNQSAAYAVNAAGVVVGTSNDRALLWENGTLIDLNTLLPPGSGWELRSAWAINNQGGMAGAGLHFGQPRGFLLAPRHAGDLNADGSVDLGDLPILAGCLAGPDVTTPPAGCDPDDFTRADLAGDGDVDLEDYTIFETAVTCP